MARECNYSYRDLYKAAFGTEPQDGDLVVLKNMPHPTREQVIQNWIARAGWVGEQATGSDGKIYTRFRPADVVE